VLSGDNTFPEFLTSRTAFSGRSAGALQTDWLRGVTLVATVMPSADTDTGPL
jgi:hypothetical protein